MDVVELDMLQPILTGSLPLNDTPEVDNPDDILAPGLGLENDLFAF